jgi:phosphoglucomutase
MATQVADNYGVRTIDCLTGVKFIGEQIGLMEARGEEDNYIFGMEESYGYLTGGYVRDKDAVDGAFMICEMFAYYKSQGIGLIEKLEELYRKYGYRLNTLHSYEFDGAAGAEKMKGIMANFRGSINEFGGKNVEKLIDYLPGVDGLPKSDVLKFILEDNCSVVVRPSGTEPKVKFYISISDKSMEAAAEVEKKVLGKLEEIMG